MKQVLIYLVEFLKEHHGISMSEMSKGIGKSRNFIREAITRGYEDEEKYKQIINDLEYTFIYPRYISEFILFIEKKHQEELYKTEIAGDNLIDSLHKKLEVMNQSEIAQDKVITKQGETINQLQQRLIESNRGHNKSIEIKNKTINDLEHRILVLGKDVDRAWENIQRQNATIVELNNTITTKDKFIDGQDEEINSLISSLDSYKSMSDKQQELIGELKKENKTLSSRTGRQDIYIKSLEEMHEDLKSDNKDLGIENNKLQTYNYTLIGLLAISSAIALSIVFLRYM